MLDRRDCLRVLGLGVAGLPALAGPSFPTTVADRVDRRYRTPGPRPTGLKATRDGLWILDAETAKAYLVQFATGQVKVEVDTGAMRPAAIESDEVGLWIAGDDGRKMIRVEFGEKDGHTDFATVRRKAEFDVPGSGPVRWGLGGESGREIGAQGLAWRRGELFLAVPPTATILVMKAQDGSVLRSMPAPGACPQGLAWGLDGSLWCADGYSRSFFKLEAASGKVIKQHMLPFAGPKADGRLIVPHGITIWQRMIYFCSPETGELYRTPLVNRMS